MLTASPLGGFREDAVSILGPLLGTDRVISFINSLERDVRIQAEAGARNAIPDITAEVRAAAEATIKPLVVSAIVVGALGGLLGAVAIWRSRK